MELFQKPPLDLHRNNLLLDIVSYTKVQRKNRQYLFFKFMFAIAKLQVNVIKNLLALINV